MLSRSNVAMSIVQESNRIRPSLKVVHRKATQDATLNLQVPADTRSAAVVGVVRSASLFFANSLSYVSVGWLRLPSPGLLCTVGTQDEHAHCSHARHTSIAWIDYRILTAAADRKSPCGSCLGGLYHASPRHAQAMDLRTLTLRSGPKPIIPRLIIPRLR